MSIEFLDCVKHGEDTEIVFPTKISWQHKDYWGSHPKLKRCIEIKSVIFNPPFTIVKWLDGEETVVKISGDDAFREDYGLAMAITRRLFGRGEFLELVDGATRQNGMTLKEYDKKMENRRKRQEKTAKKAWKLLKK